MLGQPWEGHSMLYELRIYECVPGRLPDLLKRFDTITLKLWEKHGIRQAGRLAPEDQPVAGVEADAVESTLAAAGEREQARPVRPHQRHPVRP